MARNLHLVLVNNLSLTISTPFPGKILMFNLALFLLLISLLFAVFGFTGVAASFAGVAKILFFVFIALFAISAIAAALRGRAPVA